MALVGHWKLDESSGLVAVDSSGNGNNGALENMSGSQWVTGRNGGHALDFTGIDDAVNMGDPSILRPTDITISTWIRVATPPVSGIHYIIDHYTFSQGYNFNIHSDGSGRFQFLFGCAPGYDYRSSTSNVANNQWHFLTGTYASSGDQRLRVYVDGAIENTGPALGYPISYSSTNFYLGNWSTHARGLFGILDDVRIYNTRLTDGEVLDLYNSYGPLLCWNYKARYKGTNRLYTANGSGKFPSELRVPSSVDISSGYMMDEGKLIDPRQYRIRS